MIPSNRPVIGKDLDSVRQEFGLLTADACWLFGLSITRWTQIVRQAPDEPVKDPSLALLVRFLDQHPELSVIPKFPSVAEMLEMLNGVQEIDQKRFSVLFGNEASAAYRWLKPGSKQSPAVNRLMLCLRRALQAVREDKRANMLEHWIQTVLTEGRSRGVPDVLAAGTWSTEEQRTAARAARKPRARLAKAAPAKKLRPLRKKVAAAPAPTPAPARKKLAGPRRVKATG